MMDRRVGSRLTALSIALVLLGLFLWAGWYVYNRGFTRKWRNHLTAELRRRGLDFTAARLTLNPFEGLVAEDAHLYLRNEHHSLLLYLSRVAVDINLLNLIRGKPFLNALELRGARLTIPVDMTDPDGPKIRLRHFQAKVSFQPGEVQVTQAAGDFYGLNVSVSGSLLHPENFSSSAPPPTPVELARRRAAARAALDEIRKVRWDKNPPRLEIHFQADLARPQDLRASAVLQGEALRRGNYRLDRLHVRVSYGAAAFHLQEAELADGRGKLAAQGDFNPATGEARFQLQSGLDCLALAREFANSPLLDGLTLRAPPQLRLDGSAKFATTAPNAGSGPPPPPAIQLTGNAAIGEFTWKTIHFTSAASDFSWGGDRWYLHGLRILRAAEGDQEIQADVLCDPAQLKIRLNSTIDPAPLAALLPERGRAAVADLRFRDPPHVTLSATARSPQDFSGLAVSGQIALGRTRFRGSDLNRLRSDFTFENHALSFRHITLEREEGSATGDLFVYDLDRHEVRMENVRANVDPGQVCAWIDPDVAHAVAPFHFHKPPATVTNGVVQFDGGRESRLTVDINAPASMEYVFLKKQLSFQNMTGQVLFTDDRLRLNGLHAETFGGEARGNLDLSLVRGAQDYSADIEAQNLDFARLTKLYFDYENSKGQLSATYRFTGRGDDARTLHGAGTLTIAGGNVFAIPFLGPLSTIASTVLPGLGFDVAHQATADFLTSAGKIYTGNLAAKGTGFVLFGGGWLGYVEDTMNFRVRINSRGLPGAVLYPVSKLFEYSSQGPLGKPVWHPRVLAPAEPAPVNTPAEKPPAHLFAPPSPSGSPPPSPSPEPKPAAAPRHI